MADHGFTTAFATDRTAALAAALSATIGLAAACWVVAVWQMQGMDMGVATRLGSFPSFIALWVVMMAMLVALSVTWMSVIAVLVLAQRLLPAKTAIDLPFALAIAGLGVLIIITPSLVPELSPPM
jgi:hypothetical protein